MFMDQRKISKFDEEFNVNANFYNPDSFEDLKEKLH